jgi:hypothetical protein
MGRRKTEQEKDVRRAMSAAQAKQGRRQRVVASPRRSRPMAALTPTPPQQPRAFAPTRPVAALLLERALDSYRAATAQSKREPVVHFYSSGWRTSTELFGNTACGHQGTITTDPAAVTCKACRRSRAFKEVTP